MSEAKRLAGEKAIEYVEDGIPHTPMRREAIDV